MGKNWITSTFHISKEAENIETSDLLGFLKKKTNRSLEVANNDGRLDCDAIREHFQNIDED